MEFKYHNKYSFPLIEDVVIPKLHNIDKVYHYTGIDGFEAILKNHTLRFSNIGCLNDAAEVVDGINEFYEYIKSVDPNYEEIDEVNTNNTFVFCTSTDYDNLAMWRYYTKSKKNIAGFNIAFNYDKLINSIMRLNYTTLKDSAISYGLAIYEENAKRELICNGMEQLGITINNGINQFLLFLANASVANNPTTEKKNALNELQLNITENNKNMPECRVTIMKFMQEDEVKAYFSDYIDFSACLFSKNRTFSYEKEFRIVISFTDEQLVNLKANGVIKETQDQGVSKTFLDLSFDIQSIMETNHAPLMEDEDIHRGKKIINNTTGLNHIKMSASSSSVRF